MGMGLGMVGYVIAHVVGDVIRAAMSLIGDHLSRRLVHFSLFRWPLRMAYRTLSPSISRKSYPMEHYTPSPVAGKERGNETRGGGYVPGSGIAASYVLSLSPLSSSSTTPPPSAPSARSSTTPAPYTPHSPYTSHTSHTSHASHTSPRMGRKGSLESRLASAEALASARLTRIHRLEELVAALRREVPGHGVSSTQVRLKDLRIAQLEAQVAEMDRVRTVVGRSVVALDGVYGEGDALDVSLASAKSAREVEERALRAEAKADERVRRVQERALARVEALAGASPRSAVASGGVKDMSRTELESGLIAALRAEEELKGEMVRVMEENELLHAELGGIGGGGGVVVVRRREVVRDGGDGDGDGDGDGSEMRGQLEDLRELYRRNKEYTASKLRELQSAYGKEVERIGELERELAIARDAVRRARGA